MAGTARRVAAFTMAVLMPVMAVADDCDRRRSSNSGVESNRDPEDKRVDPGRERVVLITADAVEQYTVNIDMYDERGGHDSYREYSAGGKFRTTLSYTSGREVRIVVEVKPHAPRKGAFCQIVDGNNNIVKDGPVDDGWRAYCELTTQR